MISRLLGCVLIILVLHSNTAECAQDQPTNPQSSSKTTQPTPSTESASVIPWGVVFAGIQAVASVFVTVIVWLGFKSMQASQAANELSAAATDLTALLMHDDQ